MLYAEMANKVTKINLEKRVLEEKNLQLDAYIRRENLVFLGISEDIGETTERTEVKLRNVLETKMKITNAQGMEFQRCHRIGRGQKGKSRDVIVRLLRYSCSQSVKNGLCCNSSILILCVLMLTRQNMCIQAIHDF